MAQLALFNAYESFMTTAKPYVSIANEADYDEALKALDQALDSASDALDDPMNTHIDMFSHAIENYESSESCLAAFDVDAEVIPA